MNTTLFIISIILFLMTFLPSLKITHWSVRIFDYVRIQILILSVALFIASFFLFQEESLNFIPQIILFIIVAYQAFVILPFIPKRFLRKKTRNPSNEVTMMSVNVLQKNDQHQKLVDLVKEINPDILLTMETNKSWESALEEIEDILPHSKKIPFENRYGMHLYTKLKVREIKEHFFLTDDRPAIEAHLVDDNDKDFIFWGIHPPPPSPTEKPSSRQKDGELMQLAQLITKKNSPSIVAGDFNSVCWSRSSKLFAKISHLKDARIGKGILGTFPVRPTIFRFPIDLIYSSKEIRVNSIKILSDIGSDHLPIFSTFTVEGSNHQPHATGETLKEEADDLIEEGEMAVEEEE